MWNIYDLSAFEGRTPRFTRSWLQKLKSKRREGRMKRAVGFAADTKEDYGSLSPNTRSPGGVRSPGSGEDGKDDQWGSSDEETDGKGVNIKNASQFLSFVPKERKVLDPKNKNVNEEKYFKSILKLEPQLDKAQHLKLQRNKLFNEFKHKYKNNNNAFLNE